MDDSSSQGGQQFSLTASRGAKGVGSRTAILNGQTVWSEGDQIYVSSADGGVTGVLTLSSDPGDVTGTFTGFVFGDPAKLAYSVFPAPKNGTVIDLSTIEGGGEVDAPFIGRINTSDDVDVRFEHVCGVAPIVMNGYQGNDIIINATNNGSAVTFLKGLDVTKVALTKEKPEFIIDNASNKTSTITITSPKGGQMYVPYYITSTPEANNEGKIIVDFKHGEDVVNNADVTNGFTGKVHATTVVVYTIDETGKSVENESTESEHKTIEGISTAVVGQEQFSSINSNNEQETSGTSYFNVSGLVTKTSDENPTTTQNVVAEAVEVTLPKVEATNSNENVEKSVEISFTNVTSSTTITIKEGESDSEAETNKSIDNLTVVLPSGTTAEEAEQQVVIEMPNTTVTVKSDDGNVLFIKEMTVATADNTLVVGADVEIKTLTIKKGNVQVFGKVGVIKRDDNNTDEVTVVTIEKGGIVNAVNGKDKINVEDNNKSDLTTSVEVSTFTDFKAALDNENISNIILIKPIEVEETLNIGSKTISLCNDFFTKNKTEAAIITKNNVTITGTKGSAKITGTFNAISNYIIKSEGDHLTINGVIVEAIGQFNALCVFDGTLTTANETNIISKGGFALDMISMSKAANADIGDASVIKGKVHYFLGNSENISSFIVNNSSVTGDFSYGGGAGLKTLKVVINNGGIIKGNDWPEGATGNENSDTEATPVADWAGLQTILSDPDNMTNIILTAPIELTGDNAIDLNGRILFIDENIFADHPNATAAIRSTANLTIQNGTIYGPEAGVADSERYIIEHISTNSEDNTSLTFNSVTFEGRGIEKAVHVKDGYLYFYGSDIEADIAFDLVADQKTVRVHIDATSEVSKRILFTHNHDDETGAASNESGIYIEHGAVIESSLEVSGTNANNLVLDINKDESPYYGYDDISGEGWFEATVNYLQYQLNKNGIVNMSSWDLKEDIEFEVNRDEASDKTIRFYVVEELGGNGKITFKNTGNVKLELMYTLPEGRFTCENFEKTTKVEW